MINAVPVKKVLKKGEPPSSDPGERSIVIMQDQSHPVTHVWFHTFAEASVLAEFMHLVATSPENAIIIIHLANCGGSVHTGIQLLHNIELALERGVRFELSVESPNYSMASLFASKMLEMGVRVMFGSFSYLMFHDYATYLHGKGHEITAMLEADKRLIRDFFLSCCKILFTRKEVDAILEGKDCYLTPKEIGERLQKHNKKESDKEKGKKK